MAKKKVRRKKKSAAKPKKKVARKRATHKGKRKAPRKRKVRGHTRKKATGKRLVKYVERSSTERVMAGTRKKSCSCRRKAYVAGSRRRRARSVGGIGTGTGLLIGAGVAALAIYMLRDKPTNTQLPAGYNLPPLQQSQNYTRNTQSQDIVNYAIAAGLTVSAITSLIDMLNGSDDGQVDSIYNHVNTTGDIGAWI